MHEFGHFLVAKKTGIKVEEFGFGEYVIEEFEFFFACCDCYGCWAGGFGGCGFVAEVCRMRFEEFSACSEVEEEGNSEDRAVHCCDCDEGKV